MFPVIFIPYLTTVLFCFLIVGHYLRDDGAMSKNLLHARFIVIVKVSLFRSTNQGQLHNSLATSQIDACQASNL